MNGNTNSNNAKQSNETKNTKPTDRHIHETQHNTAGTHEEVGLLVGARAAILLELLLLGAQLLREVLLLRQLVLRWIVRYASNDTFSKQTENTQLFRAKRL